jgi:hypothetical protein
VAVTFSGSEHALAQWLEDFYVCNAAGQRWVPVWKQSRRVKVGFDQLKLWYQTLDDLLAEKKRMEKAVYLELRNLFSLQPDWRSLTSPPPTSKGRARPNWDVSATAEMANPGIVRS